jgi:hypothetical protein
MGDDLINELAPSGAVINWRTILYSIWLKRYKLSSRRNATYFVPLISNNRVWSFNNNTEIALKDNIAYDPLVAPNLNNLYSLQS